MSAGREGEVVVGEVGNVSRGGICHVQVNSGEPRNQNDFFLEKFKA